MLAYPQCLRGNIPLSETMIDAVFKFYCEDGISRVSSNSKDTLIATFDCGLHYFESVSKRFAFLKKSGYLNKKLLSFLMDKN